MTYEQFNILLFIVIYVIIFLLIRKKFDTRLVDALVALFFTMFLWVFTVALVEKVTRPDINDSTIKKIETYTIVEKTSRARRKSNAVLYLTLEGHGKKFNKDFSGTPDIWDQAYTGQKLYVEYHEGVRKFFKDGKVIKYAQIKLDSTQEEEVEKHDPTKY